MRVLMEKLKSRENHETKVCSYRRLDSSFLRFRSKLQRNLSEKLYFLIKFHKNRQKLFPLAACEMFSFFKFACWIFPFFISWQCASWIVDKILNWSVSEATLWHIFCFSFEHKHNSKAPPVTFCELDGTELRFNWLINAVARVANEMKTLSSLFLFRPTFWGKCIKTLTCGITFFAPLSRFNSFLV